MATRKVTFARINRRGQDVLSLGEADFGAEMRAMGESREIRTVQILPTPQGPTRHSWVATDMELDPSETFLAGVVGFPTREKVYDLDEVAFSWIKGEKDLPPAGSDRSVVPFAVDLRPDRRWIGFGTSQKIHRQTFCQHFQAALNQAVENLGLIAANWEVDLVSSPAQVEEWLRDHPDVKSFERILRFPNPYRNLDEDRQRMRALGADRSVEKWSASERGQHLNLAGNPEFRALLEGLGEGYVQIRLSQGKRGDTFDSANSADSMSVDDWGNSLQRGKAVVMDAVRRYSEFRAGDGPQRFDV